MSDILFWCLMMSGFLVSGATCVARKDYPLGAGFAICVVAVIIKFIAHHG